MLGIGRISPSGQLHLKKKTSRRPASRHRASAVQVTGLAQVPNPRVSRAGLRQPGPRVAFEYGSNVFQKVQKFQNVELEVFGFRKVEMQKKLTASVKSSKQLSDLAEMIQQYGKFMDPICMTAAFQQLSKLGQHNSSSGSSNTAISHLQVAAIAVDQELTWKSLSSLLELFKPRAHTFDCQGLVAVATSLAKLQYSCSSDPEVYQLLLSESQSYLGSFSAFNLSSFIWAMATAGCQPGSSWLTDFYDALEDQLSNFTLRDIANTLWGLCCFDLMPEHWLLDSMLTLAVQRLQETPHISDLATILTCTARYYYKYNYRMPDEWLHVILAAAQPHLQRYSSADLVSMVHSCVCMSCLPQRPFMIEFFRVLEDRLPGLHNSDFSRLLWALSRLDYSPNRPWLASFVEVSTSKLPHLTARALCELIWTMGCWDLVPSQAWLSQYLLSSERLLIDYRPDQLAYTLSALAKLHCKVPTRWLGKALVMFSRRLSEARAHDLVTILESLTAVCEDRVWLSRQGPMLRAIADTAAAKFEFCDCIMHAKLVLALARVNFTPGAAWLTAQQASLAKVWSPELEPEIASDLKQVYQDWEVELNQQLAAELETSLSRPQLLAGEAHW